MKRTAWLMVLALFMCVSMGIPVGNFLLRPVLAQDDSICFLTVLHLRDSGYAEEQNLVINDNVEWQTVWEKVFANTSEKPPLPQVDFTHRTIIAAFQGARPSNGFEISVEQIAETETSIQVLVKAFEPWKRCALLGKITRPLDIVEIEKTQKEVVFHVKRRIKNWG